MSEQKADQDRWLILQRKLAEHRISEIFEIFRRNNIEPVLIKGWAAGLKYPKPWERYFSDIDIAVNPSEYEAARALIEAFNLSVDLHEGVRHHDTVEWDDLFKNSTIIDTGKTGIRILREEDHLRILCVHWLTDGGAYKEKLLDIFYAVTNRSAEFDWQRCLNVVSPQRQKWIIYTIGLAHKYYGLPVEDLPFAEQARRIPSWIESALEAEWKSGIRLLPLDACFNDKKMFWRQILKRIPPNPIEAIVEMEGDLDSRTRIFYQIGSIGKRIIPSLRRVFSKV